MGKSVTRALAEFVGKAHYENLPQSEVERIKMAFLETLGCMIFGSTNSSGNTLMKLAGLVGGEGKSSKPKDIPEKFQEMALKVLSDEQVPEITHIVNELESLENARSLVKLLVG